MQSKETSHQNDNILEFIMFGSVLQSSYKTGLLAALLEDSTYTLKELSEKLKVDTRALQVVLEVFSAYGYVDVTTGTEAMYKGSQKLFDANKRIAGGLLTLSKHMSTNEEWLVSGKVKKDYSGSTVDRELAYQHEVIKLGHMYKVLAADLASRLPVAKSVLDVGAGSGVWSLSMNLKHPETKVTALDFEKVLESFKNFAKELQVPSDKISVIPGNAFEVSVPANTYDRIVLANIVHLENPEKASNLIAKMGASLPSGGSLVIIDNMGDGQPHSYLEKQRSLYGLHLTMRSSEGWTYTFAQLKEWAQKAGLIVVDNEPLIMTNGSLFSEALVAVKP